MSTATPMDQIRLGFNVDRDEYLAWLRHWYATDPAQRAEVEKARRWHRIWLTLGTAASMVTGVALVGLALDLWWFEGRWLLFGVVGGCWGLYQASQIKSALKPASVERYLRQYADSLQTAAWLGRQEVTIDTEGVRWASPNGELYRRWSAFTEVSDWGPYVVLANVGNPCIIPKRVLGDDAPAKFGLLRRWHAEHGGTEAGFVRSYLSGRDAPCPKCGYNLRGAGGTACPECGVPLSLEQVAEATQKATTVSDGKGAGAS